MGPDNRPPGHPSGNQPGNPSGNQLGNQPGNQPDTLAYDVVDVFTDRPFAGNQLAVVHGGGGLSTDQCLALTREFGYSETTFPSGEVVDGRRYATRIFTPEREVPFAGHPTLGTAWVLRSAGLLTTEECVQDCGAGPVEVRLDADLVELSATPRDLAGPAGAELEGDLLALVGLSPSDLAGEVWVAGCGLSFVHVPVAEEAVVRAASAGSGFGPLAERLAGLGPVRDLLDAVNVYAVSGSSPRLTVHARVFVPGSGVPEDAATGSAAAGLGIVLAASGLLRDGGRYDIRQGAEMGRPSTLHGRVEAVDGRATACHVAGRVQPVASGRIRVPR
jgi:trans-2,3-dihydro-3-hydroxyanthranilate isomerase